MKCEQARTQLTAYLDGELEGERGSAFRGHLRGCDACRAIASDEAALRDGLRALPPIDPPASLWAGVQQKLAAAEIADAERPAWRRALASWLPRYGLVGVACAAAAALLIWRATSRHDAIEPSAQPAIAHHEATPAAVAPSTPAMDQDVTQDLAASAANLTQSYADEADSLARLATDERTKWTADRQQTFDTRVAEMRAAIGAADAGRARQKAYRDLIRYLQHAAVRDEVAIR